ncbi:hypothetical protein T492DRAFT_959269 [Pavlovales sp. CCMP2436]|nr:hypothetical protein T492DRAFT_959269 [Pavlovales sp. CCMP2436]
MHELPVSCEPPVCCELAAKSAPRDAAPVLPVAGLAPMDAPPVAAALPDAGPPARCAHSSTYSRRSSCARPSAAVAALATDGAAAAEERRASRRRSTRAFTSSTPCRADMSCCRQPSVNSLALKVQLSLRVVSSIMAVSSAQCAGGSTCESDEGPEACARASESGARSWRSGVNGATSAGRSSRVAELGEISSPAAADVARAGVCGLRGLGADAAADRGGVARRLALVSTGEAGARASATPSDAAVKSTPPLRDIVAKTLSPPSPPPACSAATSAAPRGLREAIWAGPGCLMLTGGLARLIASSPVAAPPSRPRLARGAAGLVTR